MGPRGAAGEDAGEDAVPVLDGGDENVPETSSGDGHTTTIPSNYQEGGLIEHGFYYFPPCYTNAKRCVNTWPGSPERKRPLSCAP